MAVNGVSRADKHGVGPRLLKAGELLSSELCGNPLKTKTSVIPAVPSSWFPLVPGVNRMGFGISQQAEMYMKQERRSHLEGKLDIPVQFWGGVTETGIQVSP